MTSTLQRLIDALRDELQQHGEVLGLLDAGPSSPTAASLATQAETLLTLRIRRETLQQQFAWSCQRPNAWAPAELLPLVASELQPLIRALFEEVDSLRRQLEVQVRQHHAWPGRAPLARLLSIEPLCSTSVDSSPPVNLIVLSALSA